MIYAKRDGRTVIHWPETLKQLAAAKFKARAKNATAGAKAAFTRLMRKAKIGADKWQLCACGSLCEAIPRVEKENLSVGEYLEDYKVDVIPKKLEPQDEVLRDLGLSFFYALDKGKITHAKKIQRMIEQRAVTVLAEIGQKVQPYTTVFKR